MAPVVASAALRAAVPARARLLAPLRYPLINHPEARPLRSELPGGDCCSPRVGAEGLVQRMLSQHSSGIGQRSVPVFKALTRISYRVSIEWTVWDRPLAVALLWWLLVGGRASGDQRWRA